MTKLYLTMPQPGETITEGMIVSWIAKEGDELKEGGPVAELETEKAVFEYESPFIGKVLQILHPAESRVKVGEPIAIMDVPGERAEHYLMLGIARVVDDGAAPAVQTRSAAAPVTAAAPVAAAAAPRAEEIRALADIKMSPFVRRVALEAGVSGDTLLELAGQNAEARVTKEAILSVVQPSRRADESTLTPQERRYGVLNRGPAIKPFVPPDPEAEYRIMPFSPIRLRIAENMALSKQKIPHAHTGLTVDVTHLVQFRHQYKDVFKEKYGTNLNYLSLFYPALVKAIKKFPSVNASFVDSTDKPEIRLFNRINLGVAVGTEYGLVIPVMKNLEAYDFQKFNTDINDKINRGMKKKLMPEEFAGPTLIFNNFGYFGITMGVQIIQYPLAATLGMGVIEKRVMPHCDGIAVRDVADFFLAFDHRIMDGREAGLFLSELKREIEGLSLTGLV